MTNALAPWVDLAWFPITLALVGTLGARRGALACFLGGYLFLPAFAHWDFASPLTVEKRTIPGLAFLMAVLVFDSRTILRARPRWVDLPMALFVVNPILGQVAHRFDDLGGSIDQVWINLTEWAIPYASARVYLTGPEGGGPSPSRS